MTQASARLDIVEATRAVRERVAGGARFVALFADPRVDALDLCYVLAAHGALETYAASLDGPAPSISEAVPAALWAEREARDLFGIAFEGLPDGRQMLPPLDAELLLRVAGEEVSTVLYGPVRSGIVESARWIVETAGEDFVAVYPSMFFKQPQGRRRNRSTWRRRPARLPD